MSASIPYTVTSPAVWWEILDNSQWSEDIGAIMLKRLGVRVIGYGEVGFRNFTNNARPLRTPADLKGVKFRTMQNPAHIKMIEALGGIAVPMDFTELYTALQVGTLDGQENPVVVINYARLYEVQKYVTMDGHIFTPMWLIVNEKFFQGLSDELQEVVRRAARIGTTVMRSTSQFIDVVGVEKLKEAGMEVTYLTPEQLEMFKKGAQGPVREFIVEKIGNEWVKKFQTSAEKAAAKY
jgi:TRAP-type C4-dicarboxylate transport system substrate-binding protein